jgi:hypothetical protein
MSTVSTAEPRFRSALDACVAALSRIAEYQIDSGLDRHLRDLSERKEFLDQPHHDELMALVAFTQQRTIEKLEAQVALNRLREIFPEISGQN